MDKLILSFDGVVLKAVAVGTDRITIGRKPDNDIQVDNLAVSSLHAVVTREGDDIVIEDQHSTNGTIINGQLVTRAVLKNFDVIELGKHKLKFVREVMPTGDMEKTMVMRRPLVPPAPPAPSAPTAQSAPTAAHAANPVAAPAAPAPVAPPAATLREAALQVLTGPASGRTLELTKNLTKVGSAGVQVSVIARRPTGYFITHVEGTGFPLVNGSPIGPHAVQLQDQDTIEIAGTKMSFFYKS